MPRPDGEAEKLGIEVLDEPCLNPEDKTVIEMLFLQVHTISTGNTDMTVEVIENADKKPKEITRWISSVEQLHESRPLPSVQYSKTMPDFDKLMEEWPAEMEGALKNMQFPGPEIDLSTGDYARLICNFMDIPAHKLANNRATIESLHQLFTLYIEFRDNVYFQQKLKERGGGAGGEHDVA